MLFAAGRAITFLRFSYLAAQLGGVEATDAGGRQMQPAR